MQKELYENPRTFIRFVPKFWDLASLLIIFSVFVLLAWGANQMSSPYQLGQAIPISLEISALPGYAIKTVVRMFIALFFSLIFTLTIAPLAAKNRQAEKLIIPCIDILQSVPILGFLSITVVMFIRLFPNSLLGPEFAAIFAIFTSQVWNMVLSLYQSLRTVPKEFYDTAAMLHLSTWQKYWRIEIPHAIPSLLWNTMISLSAGWFFVVASEAISVSNQDILLPGIGSYIAVAISESNLSAIIYAIITMFIVILFYDQLLFRPLLAWTEKFKAENREESFITRPWFYSVLTKAAWLKRINKKLNKASTFFIYSPNYISQFTNRMTKPLPSIHPKYSKFGIIFWNLLLISATLIAAAILMDFVLETVTWFEILRVCYLGFITGLKVTILTILASLLWIPIGVWIGLNPRFIPFVQPIIQFIAAFPINLVYPIIFTLIVAYDLNVNIWTAPLIILGTQWYILFNVIAGASNIPKELRLLTENFGVKRWLLWKKLILPAIFPFYITGAMTAAAGAWNTSIVAEVLIWGDHKLVAYGLGSYIHEYTRIGDFQRIALGIAVMCCYVLLINRFIWARLYRRSQTYLFN